MTRFIVRRPRAHRGRAAATRRTVVGAALAGVAFISACAMATDEYAPEPATPATVAVEPVHIPGNDGRGLGAWFAPGRQGGGAVLLLHGVGADRQVMTERIRFLRAAGFAVLAPDFRAHGASAGSRVTYGRDESVDARDALAWLRRAAPGERVGVIGISMGGAATLLGDSLLTVDAMVLESVYPTIRDAVRDRLRAWLGPVGFAGGALTPLALRVVGSRAGVNEAELRPIDRIAAVRAPLLMLAGTRDPYTPIGESRALFAKATAAKTMWEVEGATHEDLHAFDPPAYEARVGAFLVEHLRGRVELAVGH